MRVISLGAGVQSSAMALMFARGDFGPMPDCAIFADTQAEPAHVYQWLDALEMQLPFPLYRVTRGNLEQDVLTGYNKLPFYIKGDNREGMLRRQCTQDYKLQPLRKKVRALLAERGETQADMYIGISLDEAIRMRTSDVKYVRNVYPLIDARLTRHDCINWMLGRGFPMPMKSACYFCPFADDNRWREMKLMQPQEFAKAVKFDETARTSLKGVRGAAYLHRSCVPLGEVDLRNAADFGQIDAFGNECEGMCGV